MPIYEYQCNCCNKKFEYLVFGSEEPKQCQYCDKEEIRRLMSTCSFPQSSGEHGNNIDGYSEGSSSSSCGSCSSSNCSGCK